MGAVTEWCVVLRALTLGAHWGMKDGLTHTNLQDILTWEAASLREAIVGAGHKV